MRRERGVSYTRAHSRRTTDAVDDPVAAIDLGGTSVRAAVAAPDGSLAGVTRRPTPADQGEARVIERILDTLDEALAAADVSGESLAAIGVGAPGPCDWRAGIVRSAPNLPGWHDVPLGAVLTDATGRPAYIENDANAAALAEYAYGSNAGVDHMVYITVSTGVGGGVILDGQLWHGVYGSAGEVGHITVDFDGPACTCGNVGCVEAIASGPDMSRWVADQMSRGRASSLAAHLAPATLEGRHIVEAAQHDDLLARDALERAGRAVGFAIVSLTHVLNLELAIVGGGIMNAGPLLLEPARRVVERFPIHGTATRLRVEPWSLGDDVGLLGAAAVARSRLTEGV